MAYSHGLAPHTGEFRVNVVGLAVTCGFVRPMYKRWLELLSVRIYLPAGSRFVAPRAPYRRLPVRAFRHEVIARISPSFFRQAGGSQIKDFSGRPRSIGATTNSILFMGEHSPRPAKQRRGPVPTLGTGWQQAACCAFVFCYLFPISVFLYSSM
jgi:hypothetical protein